MTDQREEALVLSFIAICYVEVQQNDGCRSDQNVLPDMVKLLFLKVLVDMFVMTPEMVILSNKGCLKCICGHYDKWHSICRGTN